MNQFLALYCTVHDLIFIAPRSCECVCEDSVFGGEKSVCSTSSHYWDERTCQCRSKTVAPRETDAMMGNCLDDFSSLQYTRWDGK